MRNNSAKYLLGADIGGTNIKVAIYNTSGDEMVSRSAGTPLSKIIAIGCTGHGKGLYILGSGGSFIYPDPCSPCITAQLAQV